VHTIVLVNKHKSCLTNLHCFCCAHQGNYSRMLCNQLD
jgi:hypothetical protein